MFQRDIKSRFNIQNYLTDTLKIRGTLCCKEFYIYIHIYLPVARIFYLSYILFFIFLLSVSHTYVVLFLFLHLLFQHRLPDLVMYLFYSTSDCIYLCILYIYIYLYLNLYIISFFHPGILLLDHKFYTAHVHWILRSINLTNGLYFLRIHWSREEIWIQNSNFLQWFIFTNLGKLSISPSVCLFLFFSLFLLFLFLSHLYHTPHSLRIYEASPFAFRSFCLIPFINRSCSFLKLHYTLLLPREDVVHLELSCCIVEFSYLFLPIQYQWNSYQFPRLSRLSNRLTRD